MDRRIQQQLAEADLGVAGHAPEAVNAGIGHPVQVICHGTAGDFALHATSQYSMARLNPDLMSAFIVATLGFLERLQRLERSVIIAGHTM